jgi:hypothetical protein
VVGLKPQTRLILSLLRIHPDGLSQIECLQWGGGMRLSGRIHELRDAGFDIETTWETFGTARYARYVLHEQPVQLAAGF